MDMARAMSIFVVLLAVALHPARATPPSIPAAAPVYVAIIIDDLGNSLSQGERVIRLPAPIACAILPHTAFAARLARAAHEARKEVLLHLPMESLDRHAAAGPGTLEVSMQARERTAMLEYDLSTVPHAVGVNNHMGSRFTEDNDAMHALMRALHERGNLFFVDSLTSPRSVATRTARLNQVPVLVRDIFLDNDPAPAAINARLAEIVATARRRGTAVAIGHPHTHTLQALEQWLPTVQALQVKVVPLREILKKLGDNRERPVD